MRFKIDWASLWWEGNLPFLLCFSLYLRANSKYKPPGGACIWRGLFLEFYGINENNMLYEGGVYVRKPALALVSYWGDHRRPKLTLREKVVM